MEANERAEGKLLQTALSPIMSFCCPRSRDLFTFFPHGLWVVASHAQQGCYSSKEVFSLCTSMGVELRREGKVAGASTAWLKTKRTIEHKIHKRERKKGGSTLKAGPRKYNGDHLEGALDGMGVGVAGQGRKAGVGGIWKMGASI